MLTLEEEAKRFIESKKVQFIAGLDDGMDDILDYLLDNLHHSDEKDYAIKALKEAVLWSRECANKYGIR
jgi:hypothetical protein